MEGITKLAFSSNATVTKVNGYPPYYLLFGLRSPRLPIDIMFGIEPNEVCEDMQIPYKKFVDNWEKSIQQAFEIVVGHIQKSGNKNKQYYDN